MTTVDQLYSRHRKRWLTAIEKLAALGFPTTDGIADILKQEPRSLLLVFFLLCFGSMAASKLTNCISYFY